MDLADRIKSVIEYSKLSVRAFALKCELSQPTVDRYIKGKAIPTSTALTAISEQFPEISCEWLLRGDGFMLNEQNRSDEQRKQYSNMGKLVDTIATLQDVINSKNETIAILTAKINELESQLKSK